MTPDQMNAILLPRVPTWEWQEEAECSNDPNPDQFYPDKPSRAGAATLAMKYCNRCPVRAECLTTGWEDEHGIWAGTTPLQRFDARRQKQIA